MRKNIIYNVTIYTILFIILLTPITHSFIEYKNEINNNKKIALREYKKTCNVEHQTFTKDRCKNLYEYAHKKENYWEVIVNILLINKIKGFSLIIILITPITLLLCRYLKNNNFINELQRIDYSKLKKKLLFKSYIPTIVFTITLIIMLLMAYSISGGFKYNEYNISSLGLTKKVFENPIFYSFIFILINILNSLSYANITLLNIRKNKNVIQTTIMSFLTIILLELGLEIVLGLFICNIIFKSNNGLTFNIINGMTPNFSNNILIQIIFHISIFAITLILIQKKYKNKEELIIDYS